MHCFKFDSSYTFVHAIGDILQAKSPFFFVTQNRLVQIDLLQLVLVNPGILNGGQFNTCTAVDQKLFQGESVINVYS